MPVVAVQSQECLASTSRPKMMTTMWPVSRCIYVSSHRFVFNFLFIIIYSTDDCLQKTTPRRTGHHLDASPPLHITTSINMAHKKKKNTLDVTPLGMEAWQELLVGFYIYYFFFLYYRWYLLLQLSQRQRLPFRLPVPLSSSQFGLWKVVMAKIGPNNARCIIWAFSKFFFFFSFTFH